MIQKLRLLDFRNFSEKLLEFSSGTTVIVGPNGSGKTNILESIFLMSSGKSFKARVEEEMVNFNKDLARIKARIKHPSENTDLEAIIAKSTLPSSINVFRKKLLVNGIPRRIVDFSGNFKAVLFGPWDMDLVTQSPSRRRNFLDTVVSLVDREYRRALLSYEKGLRARNKLLFRIREEGVSRSQLLFWDRLLVKNGDFIGKKREELVDFINQTSQLNSEKLSLFYDKSAISEARLAQYEKEEVYAATTLVGPHRDDFSFKRSGRDMARFSSRGEQRMAVLWVKLAELLYTEEKTNEKPTLLLDDIFSELDHTHRDQVMTISKNQQTIITAADPHFIVDTKEENLIKL